MMRICGVTAARPALPQRLPGSRAANMTRRFLGFFGVFNALRVQVSGEEGSGTNPSEKAAPQGLACAWRPPRDGAALVPPREKPLRGFGGLQRGCEDCEGSPPPAAPHTAQLGAGTSVKCGERERCSEGCRRGCSPSPDQDWGARVQRKDGGEILGGMRASPPPLDVTEDGGQGGRGRSRVGVSCRGGIGIRGVWDWGPGWSFPHGRVLGTRWGSQGRTGGTTESPDGEVQGQDGIAGKAGLGGHSETPCKGELGTRWGSQGRIVGP